jgi:hypothetical protein
VGQALKTASGASDTVGTQLAFLANNLAATIPGTASAESKQQTFAIAAIKAAGTATGQIRSFTDQYLDGFGTAHETIAVNIAKAVIKVPAAAGEVLGGFANELGAQTAVEEFTVRSLSNLALAKAASYIVASTASVSNSSVITDRVNFTQDVVAGLAAKATTANRAAVASGVIQAIERTNDSATTTAVVNAALTNKTLTKAELSTFAGAAAVNTGDAAAEVATAVITHGGANADVPTKGNIAVAILKSIAATSPSSGQNVTIAIVGTGGFADDAAKQAFAVSVAQKFATGGSVVGNAVAGVGTTLAIQSVDSLTTLGAATVKVASKSALNISKEIARFSGTADFTTFAGTFAGKSLSAAGANIAAGVSVTAIGGGAQTFVSGQTPGDIVLAVANSLTALNTRPLQAKLTSIAGTTALAIDVERIALLAGKVTGALRPSTATGVGLPKITTVSAFATSITKAINTKPFVSTANRVDEIGESAAEMTRAAIAVLGPTATEAQIASTVASIGTAVMKGLSATLLINGGNFAADLKDAARDIAGSIAQTISVVLGSNVSTQALATNLIKSGGTLENALKLAAKKFGGEVLTAFGDVRGVAIGTLVAGSEPLGVGEVATGTTGKYEIGSLIDSETPVVNL